MHRDLRAAIHQTKIRAEGDERRAEELKKAAEDGLTTDDLLEADRRRLKTESETCKFEDPGEKMRDPLARLFKPRRQNPNKKRTSQMKKAARKLRERETHADKSKKKKPTKNQRKAKKKAAAAEAARREIVPPWRLAHDEDHCCSGFRKDEIGAAECSSTEEVDGETYEGKRLKGTGPRFETIYVPELPNVEKEIIGGEITPTEPYYPKSEKPSSSPERKHSTSHGRAFSSDEDGDGPPFGDNLRGQPYTAEHAMQSTSKVPPYWTPHSKREVIPSRCGNGT